MKKMKFDLNLLLISALVLAGGYVGWTQVVQPMIDNANATRGDTGTGVTPQPRPHGSIVDVIGGLIANPGATPGGPNQYINPNLPAGWSYDNSPAVNGLRPEVQPAPVNGLRPTVQADGDTVPYVEKMPVLRAWI